MLTDPNKIGTRKSAVIYLLGGKILGIKRTIEDGCYTILAYFNDNYVEGKKVISDISDPNVIANNVRTTNSSGR